MDYNRISDRLAVSPQVPPEDIEVLAKDGFTGVVNNRPDGESPGQPASPILETEASRQGLDYWHIPVVPGAMTDAEVDAFAAALREAKGPILAFCRTGNRSSALWTAAQAQLR